MYLFVFLHIRRSQLRESLQTDRDREEEGRGYLFFFPDCFV